MRWPCLRAASTIRSAAVRQALKLLVRGRLRLVLSLHLGFRGRLFLRVLLRKVMTNNAPADGADNSMVTGIVTGNTASDRALDAASRGS